RHSGAVVVGGHSRRRGSGRRRRRTGRDGTSRDRHGAPMKLFGVDLGPMRPKRPGSPRRYFTEMTRGEALYPLLVLFGLQAVEQLDQNAFAVLAPDIRAAFHLSLTGLGAL